MINYVRIVDVVGSIDPTYGSYDSEGNLINDPFPTEFSSGGFDIDAVGLIHANGDYTTGLDKLESTVNVYPNPSQQFIKISSTDEVKNIELFDLNGRQILSTKETEIDLGSLSITSGIYILKIQTAKGMVSEKITFNKL
jgi:hypothetical protein